MAARAAVLAVGGKVGAGPVVALVLSSVAAEAATANTVNVGEPILATPFAFAAVEYVGLYVYAFVLMPHVVVGIVTAQRLAGGACPLAGREYGGPD